MTDPVPAPAEFGPWNPGIVSQVPRPLRHLCTIYRPENVFTSLAQADEMHDLTGLEKSALVTFRPARLALHEVLIRVTADLSVPDGSKIEDLGINFRRMTRAILARCVDPRSAEIEAAYEDVRKRLRALIDAELGTILSSRQRAQRCAGDAREGIARVVREPKASHRGRHARRRFRGRRGRGLRGESARRG